MRQFFTQEKKRKLTNVVLCFHGCVLARADALIFREHIDDMRTQVNDLINSGYTFVMPSAYDDWYDETVINPAPIAVIHLDDGLDSIIPFCEWLIAKSVPFGIGVISSRQNKFTPQQGFLKWSQIKAFVDSGFCELQRHTHNIHNLTIFDVTGAAGPVLEGPCWVDEPANIVYKKPGDVRWYWDFDIIDKTTWGFPVMGADPYTGFSTVINSTINIRAEQTLTVNVIRFWAALHRPAGAGYDCQVNIKVDGVSVGIYTITPKVYETRTQWVEREFYSITLAIPFNIVAGTQYQISFETLNTGRGTFVLYALPECDDNDFYCITSCVSFTEDKKGPDYSDFPAGRKWPARAAIILASGSGRQATNAEYSDYIEADIVAQNNAIENWLNADWFESMTNYKTTRTEWSILSIAGTNVDGSTVSSMLSWVAVRPAGYSLTDTTMVVESLTFRQSKPIGLRYAALVKIEIGNSADGPWTFVGEWVPGWDYYKWVTIDINSTTVTIGHKYWFRFTTLNRSYNADYPLADDPNKPGSQVVGTNLGKIAIFLDTPYLRTVTKVVNNQDSYGNEVTYYFGNGFSRLIVDNNLIDDEGNYYDPFYPDFGLFWPKFLYWEYNIKPHYSEFDKFCAWCSSDDTNSNYFLLQYPNTIRPGLPTDPGPGVGGGWSPGHNEYFLDGDGSWNTRYVSAALSSQIAIYGSAVASTHYGAFGNLLFGAKVAVRNPSGISYPQMIYPFGSFFSEGELTAEVKPVPEINTVLATLFSTYGIVSGYTIWPSRNDVQSRFREEFCRCTPHTKSRMLLYGDVTQNATRSDIANYTGLRWADAQHGGIKWQIAIEPDQFGNATVKNNYSALHTVAFDAWFFRVPDGLHLTGWILQDAINDGGTWDSVVYHDDKTFLQDRGVVTTLILSNYDDVTGDVSPTIASYVVNHPSEFIADIVSITTTYNWDGITCNLEGIPQADRAAATSFYQQLGTALKAAGKELHITAPAFTNTDYDLGSEWWWGWCDHGAIIGYVDRMKIMTYTETGPGTPPGPHAPDWFMAATYDYIVSVIQPEHRKRILVGSNSFGHIWHDAIGTSVDYASSHQAMAAAITVGAEIGYQDGEAFYKHGADQAWWGCPQTINRAVDVAVKYGFGGVGIWKGDDGDIDEHFPIWPQIGVLEMAGFLDIEFPEKARYGFTGGPVYKTGVGSSDSGAEQRILRWNDPLYEYTCDLLKMGDAIIEVMSFFRIVKGRYQSFRFRDWLDYKATDSNIGVGNSSQLTFQLRKAYSYDATTEYRTITKPVVGSVVVKLNGVITTALTVDHVTGIITFSTPPGTGVAISASFEFDVHARFDQDKLPVTMNDPMAYSMTGIKIIEVR